MFSDILWMIFCGAYCGVLRALVLRFNKKGENRQTEEEKARKKKERENEYLTRTSLIYQSALKPQCWSSSDTGNHYAFKSLTHITIITHLLWRVSKLWEKWHTHTHTDETFGVHWMPQCQTLKELKALLVEFTSVDTLGLFCCGYFCVILP